MGGSIRGFGLLSEHHREWPTVTGSLGEGGGGHGVDHTLGRRKLMSLTKLRSRVQRLLSHLFFGAGTHATGISEHARSAALAVLAKNGMLAHYYMAAVGIEDAELANALRFLSSAGYIITQESSVALVGKVATVTANKIDPAETRRAKLHLVDND